MSTMLDRFSERPKLEGQPVNTIAQVPLPAAESWPTTLAALLADRDFASDAAADAGIDEKGADGGRR